MTSDFPVVNFPWLSGDVPRLPSYGIYISQLVRFARCCTSVLDFHSKNLQITSKLLTQGYRYHKLRKTFGKFFRSYSELLSRLLQPSDLSSLSAGWSTAGTIRMSLYIFLIYNIYKLCCLCIDFYDLSAWCGCWFVVYIRRFIYKFLNVCPFDYTDVAGSEKVGP